MTIQLFQPIEIYSGVVKFNAIKMKRYRTERCKNFQYKNSGTIVFNLPALNWFSRSNDYFILVNERAILLTNCIYRHEIDWLTGKFHWMKCEFHWRTFKVNTEFALDENDSFALDLPTKDRKTTRKMECLFTSITKGRFFEKSRWRCSLPLSIYIYIHIHISTKI